MSGTNKENPAIKKRILYVEDNFLNALVVENYLSEYFEVEHAKNANEGLDKVTWSWVVIQSSNNHL